MERLFFVRKEKEVRKMTLKDVKIGQRAVITAVGGEGALRQHFLDMGVIPDAEVTVIKYAPMGDPMELMIHGYELTLRLEDADRIQVRELDRDGSAAARITDAVPEPEAKTSGRTGTEDRAGKRLSGTSHPGLGEGGKFHPKGSGNPV